MKTKRFFQPADRYHYDFKFATFRDGYAQIDTEQDASYYGTWANPFKREIINYAEGDHTIQTAGDEQEFVDEIREIKEWSEGLGYRFIGIDPGSNKELKQKFIEIGLGDLL